MKKNEEILSTITREQWEAIAILAADRAGKKVPVQLQSNRTENGEKELRRELRKLLVRIGVPAHLKGYNFINEALVLAYYNQSYIGEITKKLYPEIAKKFGTTASRVERAIRHAFEVAINNGDIEFHQKIFTMSVNKGKPTNSEAIAELVEYLKMN